MTIHKEILDSWSKQGATKAPKILRERIEKVLTNDRSKIKKKINWIYIFKDHIVIIRIY